MIFDMSDLKTDQFDVNFGLAIFICYGQFASTATRASSSTSRKFLYRLQLRGILGNDAACPVCFDPYSFVLCVLMAYHLPLSLDACIPIEWGVVLHA